MSDKYKEFEKSMMFKMGVAFLLTGILAIVATFVYGVVGFLVFVVFIVWLTVFVDTRITVFMIRWSSNYERDSNESTTK